MSLPSIPSQLSLTSTIPAAEASSSKRGTPAPTRPPSPTPTLAASPVVYQQGIRIGRQATLDRTPAGLIASALAAPPNIAAAATTSPVPNPYPGKGTSESPFLVDWLPEEVANPYNWRNSYKWFVTAVVAIATLCIAFVSSSYSAAFQDILREFPGTNTEEGIAGLSLYVLGFGIGPLLWAPVSEIYGRNVAFLVSFPLFAIWNMAGALAHNIESILVFRLLAGTFGSAPLVTAGGQIGDIWAPNERALAASLFALAPFLGPVLGPIVGNFVAENVGWRWVFWVQFIFACVMLVASALFVPETYAPILLRRKARHLQAEADARGTGEVFISKFDVGRKSRVEIVKVGLARPFAMLFQELIVFALGLYAAIIYGTLYLFFTAFPIVFQQYRGWTPGMSGLAFLGIGVGLLIGTALNPIGQRYYLAQVRKAASSGGSVPPEARLPMMCVGSIMLPIGLFWFAWTSQPSVHWIVPILASVPFGAGFLLIFSSINLYLIDSYSWFAASALASNAVMRSIFGTVFPLFSTHLYRNLGLNWAGTLIAFLSLACTPMPFLFMKYGAYLRRNSKYAPSNVGKEETKQAEELEPELAVPVAAQTVEEKRGAQAV